MKNNGDLKNHLSKTLILAFPVMLTQLGQITVNLADNIMVGKLGKEALGAVSLGNAVFFMMVILGFGVSSVLTPLIAEKEGQNARISINELIKNSLLVNVILSLILFVIALFIAPNMQYFGQPEDVILLAKDYFIMTAFSFIPMMIFQTFRHFSEGMSLTYPITYATIIANIINVGLNYLLIYGNFGFPKMGVEGAAIGTLISRVVLVFLLIWILLRVKRTNYHIRRFWKEKYQKNILQKLLKLGIPTGFQMFFEVSAFGLAAFIAGMAGKNDLAAHQIAINLASVSFLLCTGLGAAAAIRVGNQFGLKDQENLRKAGYSAILITFIFMLISGIVFILLREELPLLYLNDPEVLEITTTLMIIAALFQLSDGLQVVTLGILRGLQDVNIPTLITFVSYWIIAIPVSYISAISYELGAVGVWIGLGLGLTISAAMLMIRFYFKSKKI